jgi:O-antigen ligase
VTASTFWQPLFTRFDPSARLEAKSFEERQSQYATFDDVWQRNLVTGVGYGAYTLALSEVLPGRPSWMYQPIHNAPLLFLSEVGVVGLATILFFIFRAGLLFWPVSKTLPGIFILTLGASLSVLALFDHYFWSSWPGLALVALVLALEVRWLTEGRDGP